MKKKLICIFVSMLLFATVLSVAENVNVQESIQISKTEGFPLSLSDNDPPEPSPLTWVLPPAPVNSSAITMTATKAYDETPPIQYFVFCWGGPGGSNSGWQESRIYVDNGLDPNTQYKYQVRARDNADPRNYGAYSFPAASTYTLAEIPSAPLLSGETGSTININVQPNGNPSYTMFTIKCNSNDASWDEKYVDASGNPSSTEVWQTDAQWGTTTVQGLNLVDPDKYYCFRVKAINEDLIQTTFGAASFLHYIGPYPPGDFTASAVNRTKIDVSWITGNNADKTYIRYKQGAFPPSDREDGIFLYNDTGTSTSVTGLPFGTQYSFKAWSWDDTDNIWGAVTSTHNVTTKSNAAPMSPNINGPVEGEIGEYTFTIVTEDPDEDDLTYHINWGDSTSDEFGPYASSVVFNVTHVWNEVGTYQIKVNATDIYDLTGSTKTHVMSIINNAPGVPEIDGPEIGEIDEEYTFTIVAEDDDGHPLTYHVDWRDGNTSDYGPFPAGEAFDAVHTWSEVKGYSIKVTANDTYDDSPIGTHAIDIVMPELWIKAVNGGLGISVVIKNIGEFDVNNIEWTISINGGIIILPLGREASGTIETLAAGDEVTFKTFVFGIGSVTIDITVNADKIDEISQSESAFVLLFLVIK